MASEHNGNLIAALYAANNTREARVVLEEMDEIKDPSFIAAMMVAYEKFKDTSISHYFISSLKVYSTPQVKDFLIKIALDPKSSNSNFVWTIEFLTEIKFRDDYVILRLLSYLTSESDYSGWEVTSMAEYLNFAGVLEANINIFLKIIEDVSVERDAKRSAVKVLLKANAAKFFQHFIDNFDELKKTQTDNIIAEVLTVWNGTIVTALEEKILKEGNDRAKDFIKAKREAKEKQLNNDAKKKAESITSEYSNADIMSDIYELRKTINILSLSDVGFGFPLFPDSDSLVQQIKSANSEADLINNAIVLRSTIQLFNEDIKNHGIDFENSSKLIPNTTEQEMNSSLNRFKLFMISRNKPITDDLFGLRKLNFLPNKIAHPDDQKGFVDALTKNGLLELYKSADWKGIHRRLLQQYKDALESIAKSLGHNAETGN